MNCVRLLLGCLAAAPALLRAEENTIAAFELSWKRGCYPECDVRTTSDAVIVTFHDGQFGRTVKNLPPCHAAKKAPRSAQ